MDFVEGGADLDPTCCFTSSHQLQPQSCTPPSSAHSLPVFGGIANILPPASPAPSPPSASTPAILVSGQKQCTATQCLDISSSVWPCRAVHYSAPCCTVQCPVPYSAVCRSVPCLDPCRQHFCNPCSIRALPPKCCCTGLSTENCCQKQSFVCLTTLACTLQCSADLRGKIISFHFVNLCKSLCFFFTLTMLFRGAKALEPFLRIERLDGGERSLRALIS